MPKLLLLNIAFRIAYFGVIKASTSSSIQKTIPLYFDPLISVGSHQIVFLRDVHSVLVINIRGSRSAKLRWSMACLHNLLPLNHTPQILPEVFVESRINERIAPNIQQHHVHGNHSEPSEVFSEPFVLFVNLNDHE